MSIKFDRDTWFEAFWFLDADQHAHESIRGPEGGLCDIMAALHRPIAGGNWTFVYRFRYGTRTSDPVDDRRSWYEGTQPADAPVDKVLDYARRFLWAVAETMGAIPDETIIRGDGIEAMRRLAGKPWIHITVERRSK